MTTENFESFDVIDDYENKTYVVPQPKPPVPDFPVVNQPSMRMPSTGIRGPAPKSVRRLEMLKFDPISRLVDRHASLSKELEYQEKRRRNEVIELTTSGKARAFMMDHLMMIHNQLFAIEKELLRYGYARVPENTVETAQKVAPLVINLTSKGGQYVINDYAPQINEDDE
jgi:hypothetical protein